MQLSVCRSTFRQCSINPGLGFMAESSYSCLPAGTRFNYIHTKIRSSTDDRTIQYIKKGRPADLRNARMRRSLESRHGLAPLDSIAWMVRCVKVSKPNRAPADREL